MNDRKELLNGPDNSEPMHPWNGTDDGHDCADCHPESIWKCDKTRHDENEQMRADIKQGLRRVAREMFPALRAMREARFRTWKAL